VYWKLLKEGVGKGKEVRESNWRSWLDQSKVHPQWAYIHWDTPLNINLKGQALSVQVFSKCQGAVRRRKTLSKSICGTVLKVSSLHSFHWCYATCILESLPGRVFLAALSQSGWDGVEVLGAKQSAVPWENSLKLQRETLYKKKK
jgi:hypothetical protein